MVTGVLNERKISVAYARVSAKIAQALEGFRWEMEPLKTG